ncbi:DUF3040 domain-containing protein [Aeromicrobium massiliense]|uniref:DUF3040 domain-containing protein n=1 Tax=Aeromicrobium massiliense TaxID=1464554 RepID=UPI00031A329A|nr:DUF3040 domain-containing protein [Aeromicrobium massiliense]
MPLSDEEARLLQQLEQSLAAEDPEFASTLRGSRLVARTRRVAVLSALGFLAGIGLLLAGVMVPQTILGVIGFVAMLGSAYLFVTSYRRGLAVGSAPSSAGPKGPRGGKGRKPKSSGSFTDRMEQRWNRRRDGDEY